MASNGTGLGDALTGFVGNLTKNKTQAPPDTAGGINAVGGSPDSAAINRANRTAYGGQTRIYNPDGTVAQQSGADIATQRYQNMGEAAASRGAYQANYGGYNASMGQAQGAMGQAQDARGSQQSALSLQQQAAYGNAPSAAQIQGQQMIGQSLQAQMAGAASARGGSMAQAMALRNAGNNAATYTQQGTSNLAAARAQEMAGARDSYAGESNALRQSDYAGAGLDYTGAGLGLQQTGQDISNHQFQNQLTDVAQANDEKLGYQVQHDNQQAALGQAQIDSSDMQHQQDLDEHSTDRDTGVAASFLGAVGSAGSALTDIFTSDVRAKRDARALSGDGHIPPGLALAIQRSYDSHRREHDNDRLKSVRGVDPAVVRMILGHGSGDILSSEFAKDPIASLTDVPSGDPNLDAVSGAYAEHPAFVLGSPHGSTPAVSTPERGMLGAPKGYAASRAGQPGAMNFEPDAPPDIEGIAPGTGDYMHAMGGGLSLDGREGAQDDNAFATSAPMHDGPHDAPAANTPATASAAQAPAGAAPGKPKPGIGSMAGSFGSAMSKLG